MGMLKLTAGAVEGDATLRMYFLIELTKTKLTRVIIALASEHGRWLATGGSPSS